MTSADLFTLGCIIAGLLLVALTLGSSFLGRLPLSAAMLYLALGVAIGPMGWGLPQAGWPWATRWAPAWAASSSTCACATARRWTRTSSSPWG